MLAGRTNKTIVQELGMTPQAISYIFHSPIFQDELARRRERMNRQTDEMAGLETQRAKRIIERSSVNAAKVQVECLDDENPRVRQKAASEILDRVGFTRAKSDRAEPTSPDTVVISDKHANTLLEVMRECDGDQEDSKDDLSNQGSVPVVP